MEDGKSSPSTGPSTSAATRARSRREIFEQACRPLQRSYPAINLRDNDDHPVASTSKSPLICDTCTYKSLEAFRAQDKDRKARLHKLFQTLQDKAWVHEHTHGSHEVDRRSSSSETSTKSSGSTTRSGSGTFKTAEERRIESVRQEYLNELYAKCCEGEDHLAGRGPTFAKFESFVEAKEEALWNLFVGIDVNEDMLIDPVELEDALSKADINVSASNLHDMIREMDKSGSGKVTFEEWRDFLLLLPRQTSMQTVYNYWASFSRPRLATSIMNQDLDVIVAEKPSTSPTHTASSAANTSTKGKGRAVEHDDGGHAQANRATHLEQSDHTHSHAHSHTHAEDVDDAGGSADDEELDKPIFEGSGAYLLAGGLAGAVSRTATAPFDRLKVFLINHVEKSDAKLPGVKDAAAHPLTAAKQVAKSGNKGLGAFASACKSLYLEGGLHAFFIGNGLNIVKIFPESAVKFWSYEYSKRWFARNVDRTSVKDISGSSRFIAGGIGGLVSQLLIYPLETWKTRVMSSTSSKPDALRGNALYAATARDMWRKGGLRTYYKGLNMGLIGVFPYSAIDMSLFAAFKKAYVQYTGDEEPGALGSLTFGALSGGLGATSVYPLNLMRTRLQTQGTRAHPHRYTGWRDVGVQCYRNEGLIGFYKGLSPTLLKVMPSMGISWLVYEYSTSIFFPHQDHPSEPEEVSED